MTSLKDINFGMNQYCGPSVLSALTGKSTDECASVISSISGKAQITFVEINHLLAALKRLRFTIETIKPVGNSLYANLVSLKPGMYVIIVPRHVIAVEATESERYLIDNHTKRAINAASSARLMQTVQQIWKVVPLPPKRFLRTEIKVEWNQAYSLGKNIRLTWNDIYENNADNETGSMGSIYLRKREDLDVLVQKLRELK